MTEKIQSRPFCYGSDKESKWPSRFGTAKAGSIFYYDSESGTMKPGYPPSPVRRYGQAPSIRTDEMPPTECMANAKVYTSKRKYRDAIKSHGYELTEGERVVSPSYHKDDTEKREADIAGDIEKSYHQVKNGEAPLTELDKELCKINNRVIKNKQGRKHED